MVFLNIKARQVYFTPSTDKPDEAAMIEQAGAFIKHTHEQKLPCKIVMHDNDGKYSKPFLEVFKNAKFKLLRTAIRSPNTVAFVERVVQTFQQECLDHFIVLATSTQIFFALSLKPIITWNDRIRAWATS